MEKYIPVSAACRSCMGADGCGTLFPSVGGAVPGIWHVDCICAGLLSGISADIVQQLLLLFGRDAFAGEAFAA